MDPRGRARLWIAAALGFYALVLLGSPVLHHDFECHLKTPGHCDACAANPHASRIETGLGLTPASLIEAGRVQAARPSYVAARAGNPASGRAPPA